MCVFECKKKCVCVCLCVCEDSITHTFLFPGIRNIPAVVASTSMGIRKRERERERERDGEMYTEKKLRIGEGKERRCGDGR